MIPGCQQVGIGFQIEGSSVISRSYDDIALVDDDADIWAYLIGFTNTQTGEDGVLNVTEETLHALTAACPGLVGRKFQVEFYADDEEEDYEDAEYDSSEALSWGIHITSIAVVVTVYTAK